MSWITQVFLLKLYRVQKLQNSFLYNSIVSKFAKVFLLKLYRVQPYIKLFPLKLDRVQNCKIVSSGIISCPKFTKVFPLKLYCVQNYKLVSSQTTSCPKLQNRFLWNYFVSEITTAFPLEFYLVQIFKKCFLRNYIMSRNNKTVSYKKYRVQNYKVASSGILSCPKLKECLLWNYILSKIIKCFLCNYIVSKVTQLFPLKLYRVPNYKSVSSELISCPKLQKCFLRNRILSKLQNWFLLNYLGPNIIKTNHRTLYAVPNYMWFNTIYKQL